MKKQIEKTFLSDWQILHYSNRELDNDQKAHEIEEEEYKFFNFKKEDYNDLRKCRLRMKNS
jgi:hypothetical protein